MITAEREHVKKDGVWQSEPEPVPGTQKPLATDLYDSDRRFAFEYISDEDFSAYGGIWNRRGTVGGVDVLEVTLDLADNVRANGRDVHFVAFYDPMASREAEAKELLREQVRDFVAWMNYKGML